MSTATPDPFRRRRRVALVVAFVVAWAVISGVALLVRRGPIEHDLTRRAQSALERAGVGGTTVSYAGEDATVRGDLADPAVRARAEAAVRSVNGTHTVRIAGATPPPTTSPPSTPPPTTAPATPLPATSPPSTPAPTAPDTATRLRAALGGDTVRFATGSAALTSADTALLARVRTALADGSGPAIRITGHTDATGTVAINGPLSLARARAVAAYLEAGGVPGARLTTSGAGASAPVASNGTAAGRAANRRVEITTVP